MASRPSGRYRTLAVSLGLLLTASLGALPGAQAALAQEPDTPQDGPVLSYVVNTKATPGHIKRVKRAVAEADGTVVTAYRQIGVVIAHSANPDFARELRRHRAVDSAGATRTAPLVPAGTTEVGAPEYVEEPAARPLAASDAEPLEPRQWALPAIKADRAHRISEGSKKVTVAVIDTGVDDTHPDLAPNFSAEQSASCVGGKPDTSEGAWRPYGVRDYHGTHVAGTIAAARNGIGVAGTAPGVRVSSIKVSEPDSRLFYTEAVVCAFVFAAERGVEITNNSYYVDPWLFTCKDEVDQKALLEAVRRAAGYASHRGVLHIASAGNSAHDLAARKILDDTSPNDSVPTDRTVNPAVCPDLPAQLPGVLTVSATGSHTLKSSYSNHGLGVIDIAAPGGDNYQIPEKAGLSSGILSTMPGQTYAYLQGTSMAGPHVAGVAALIKSKRPWAGPWEISWRLQSRADNPGCPGAPYDPQGDGEADARCTGTRHFNSFYGWGIVDALDAVKR